MLSTFKLSTAYWWPDIFYTYLLAKCKNEGKSVILGQILNPVGMVVECQLMFAEKPVEHGCIVCLHKSMKLN